MIDFITQTLDNLAVFFGRLVDLPVIFLIPALIGVFIGLWLFILLVQGLTRRKGSRRYERINNTPFFIVASILLATLLALFIDRKFNKITRQVEQLDRKIFNTINDIGIIDYNLKTTQNRLQKLTNDTLKITQKPKLYDLQALKQTLGNDAVVAERNINDAIDLIVVRNFDPLYACFIAVVDLKNPSIKIALTPQIKEKYSTSKFALQNNCILAINGEAGRTPAAGSGLGPWVGNYVVDGKMLLKEAKNERPFIGFDSLTNTAIYSPEPKIDLKIDRTKFNQIFGRFDILLNGDFKEGDDQRHYARTIMGINETGTKLYLMVVDGRQPQYSNGQTYEFCANALKSIGAYHAMACDQGGSSCIYIEPLGGLISRPADVLERDTYTHFGIKMK